MRKYSPQNNHSRRRGGAMRKIQPVGRHDRSRRSGVGALQLILALPILLISTLAIFQFSFFMLVNQAVIHASIEGAREAEKGSTCEEVGEIVAAILAVHDLHVSPTGNVHVLCERRSGLNTIVESAGNVSVSCPLPATPLNKGEVRVTVCTKASDHGKPIPNWLSSFGFSLSGKKIKSTSLARLE